MKDFCQYLLLFTDKMLKPTTGVLQLTVPTCGYSAHAVTVHGNVFKIYLSFASFSNVIYPDFNIIQKEKREHKDKNMVSKKKKNIPWVFLYMKPAEQVNASCEPFMISQIKSI